MSARVVAVELDGRLVARKPAHDGADAIRLHHEAEVLADARHPGAVELVGIDTSASEVALLTEFAGSHSLDTTGRMTVERAAGLVAALAETVADLHELGLVHGRIDRSHVVIGAGGRPVLCGFGGGGRIGSTPPPGPLAAPGFRDPAATDEAALTPQVDVYGLGAILRALVVDDATDVEPIPDRRFTLGRLHTPWSGYQQRALLTLADRATDESPLRRPSARRLAADIHETVPSARLGDDDDPFAALRPAANDDTEPSRATRFVSLAAIGVGLVLVALGVIGLQSGGSVAEAGATTTKATMPTQTTTEPVSVGDDGVIVMGTKRYAAGEPGDRVAIGDWNCDGRPTAALVRPSTGEVFVFDDWATPSSDVSVAPITLVEGAVDVRTRDDADGCSTLIVIHGDGTEEEVPQ